jgi:glycosyltransferase involved in cell wall biosynthesis
MSSFFKDATILIISPQPWGRMRISKHHYAIEATKLARQVFFLEPPGGTRAPVSIVPVTGLNNLSLVRHRRLALASLRFHARAAYDLLMRSRIRRIRKVLPPLDLVWCFEVNLFTDLRRFGARKVVYHPVDPISYRYQIEPARTADLVLSVSEQILANFRHLPVPTKIINHGLATDFAQATSAHQKTPSEPVRFGYCGTLLRRQIDHDAIMRIIRKHRDVKFIFWGAYEVRDSNLLRGKPEENVERFVKFLAAAPNVELRGVVPPAQLASEMQEMDGFLLAYNADDLETDNSNSHKILEYLSTGKVVVAYPISHYRNRPDLIHCGTSATTEAFVETFDETLQNLTNHNSLPAQRSRRNFALEQTYEQQLERISALLRQ